MDKDRGKLLKNTKETILRRCKKEFDCHNYKGLYNALFLAGKYLYTFNLEFFDDNLEKYIRALADNVVKADDNYVCDDSVVFFDSLGLSNRGLSKIYIKALLKLGMSLKYVTYSEHYLENSEIRDLIKKTNNTEVFYINRCYSSINVLYNIIKDAKCIFLYTYPEDIIALSAAYKAKGTKYLINFTDHAFWYGASILDYDIEFRDFGINVSLQERKIEEKKIIKLPYYPEIDDSIEFQGYPNSHMNSSNTVFSGGSVYKTLDKTLTYYKFIDKLMSQYENLFFWYAGYGNYSELEKLRDKYKGRFYITGERRDLFQVMRHSRIFLNTYPMIGGLMSQYAICAGIPAMTLISDDSETGVLLKSGESYFEYYDKSKFWKEMEDLIEDDDYYKKRCQNSSKNDLIMKQSTFDEAIEKIVKGESNLFKYERKPLSFDYLRETYVQRFNWEMYCKAVCKKNFYMASVFWKYYFALAFIMWKKLLKAIIRRIKCK